MNRTFSKCDEFGAIGGSFGDVFACLFDGGLEVKPFWLELSNSNFDGGHI